MSHALHTVKTTCTQISCKCGCTVQAGPWTSTVRHLQVGGKGGEMALHQPFQSAQLLLEALQLVAVRCDGTSHS